LLALRLYRGINVVASVVTRDETAEIGGGEREREREREKREEREGL
jgi:hypothetical protein